MGNSDAIHALFQAVERINAEPMPKFGVSNFIQRQLRFILAWHPEYSMADGIEKLANQIACPGIGVSSISMGPMLEEAAIKAKAQGSKEIIKECETICTRYDVVCGMCINERPKTIQEVYDAIDKGLREKGLLPDEGLSIWGVRNGSEPWPKGRWVACYGVRGGSEGYWLHVGVIVQNNCSLWERKKNQFTDALVTQGCGKYYAEQYARTILDLEKEEEYIDHVFSAKTLLEGKKGLELIYRAAQEIEAMFDLD
jgi:hypothetical protein